MGSGTTSTSNTTTVQQTDEEKALNAAKLKQFNEYEPGQTTMYNNAFALGNKLLTSFGNSDQWNTLIGGVTDKQTRNSINLSDRGLRTQGQSSGILDSGTMASGRMRAGADIANTNAQFNVGALQNALNLALGGQAQVQGTANASTNSLSTSLAGLRTNNTTGNVPSTGQNLGILGTWGSSYYGCWVAAEIFDGWNAPKTCKVRYYIANIAPTWFRKFYYAHGEKIAKFIHNKPIFKLALRPLFECFALMSNGVIVGGLL